MGPDGGSLSRREALSRWGMGMRALALEGVLRAAGAAEAAGESFRPPLAPKPPHFPARAKRIIHLFMNGGPSHLDTFDPKPLLARYAGKPLPVTYRTERKTGAAFPSPFAFRKHGQSGIDVSDLFPHLAESADRLCVIRSMQTDVPNHEPSLLMMNCGDARLPRPSFGSWVTYGLGSENQNLPGFVVLCPNGYPVQGTDNWRAAFLPGAYQGTYIDTKSTDDVEQLIENIRHRHSTPADQGRQLALLAALNRRHQADRRDDPAIEARIQSFELAARMQLEAVDAFDISREPAYIRELYGDTTFGRQTLIARRLVERGVRVVQVWHGAVIPWDSHSNLAEAHRSLAGECDQPIGALLKDLAQRGLLDETLVLWGGEFGRTPTVELSEDGSPANGRDHNPYGFTVWLAGGGVKGGQIYGATDEFGFRAVEKPVHVHDLHATLLHLLGFDHEKLTYRYAGRDFRLTDVHGNVVHEILA